MRLALDSNAYVEMARGDAVIAGTVRSSDEIFLPLIVLAELRAGFAYGNKTVINEKALTRFLDSPRVRVLVPDEQTTHHYARLYVQLRKQGTPIPINDLWIAALVVQHDLRLLSRDKHFDNLPQILRTDPVT